MHSLWLAPALLCYALSVGAFILGRFFARGRSSRQALVLLGAGAVFHLLAIVSAGLEAGNIPVSNFAQALSFLAWLTAVAGLVLMVRFGLGAVGVFVAATALMATGAAYAMSASSRRLVLPATLRSVWLPIHVTLAVLGDTLFVLAAGVSVVYLVQESRLKAKRPIDPAGERMPSLEKLDRINYRLLGWGFLMLSLAIVTGAIWAEATWGRFWSWEPRESWSLVLWFLYAGLLESRVAVGWRGRRAAALTLVLFTVLLGSFLGVNLIFPGKHGGSFG